MTTLLAAIILLGVIIFIHELGHYLAARSIGVKVERFSIGYPPKGTTAKQYSVPVPLRPGLENFTLLIVLHFNLPSLFFL